MAPTHWRQFVGPNAIEGAELRDWVDAGAWLSPGDRIVVQSLPPQVPNEHGHVLTTAALWKMYVEEPETPDEPRAG